MVKVSIKGDTIELDGKPDEIIELLKHFIAQGQIQLPKKDKSLQMRV